MKRAYWLALFFSLFCVLEAGAQEAALVKFDGISVGMNKKNLLDNWGFPSKREYRSKMDIWYYANENTPNPTDGILVYFHKGKIKNWKVVENMYKEMRVWGKEAGTYP